ncbi:hypothetical protein [Pseudomonas sp.]|uniref:hypothetical protein n=1 Tax=Pseudomonas sp. TaxID=306 RepID=UPI0028AC2B41|nr:hypothetical protein [Pseudomonas sp.]
MRRGPLYLSLVLSLALPLAQAEEAAPPAVAPAATSDSNAPLERAEPPALAPSNPQADAERAQLAHLRQENARLRNQLQARPPQPQPQQPSSLLDEQQRWFAVGGGVGILGYLLGVLTTRGRRRRQWLN